MQIEAYSLAIPPRAEFTEKDIQERSIPWPYSCWKEWGHLTAYIQLYDKPMTGELSVQEVRSSGCLDRIHEKLEKQKSERTTDRTSNCRLQYMAMVDTVPVFFKAENKYGTGCFIWSPSSCGRAQFVCYISIHLHTTDASAADTHPDVFAFFISGHHVVHRSDIYWAVLGDKTNPHENHKDNGRPDSRWLVSMPTCCGQHQWCHAGTHRLGLWDK